MCWILQLITAQCAESASNLNESNKSTEICSRIRDTCSCRTRRSPPVSTPKRPGGSGRRAGREGTANSCQTHHSSSVHHLFVTWESQTKHSHHESPWVSSYQNPTTTHDQTSRSRVKIFVLGFYHWTCRGVVLGFPLFWRCICHRLASPNLQRGPCPRHLGKASFQSAVPALNPQKHSTYSTNGFHHVHVGVFDVFGSARLTAWETGHATFKRKFCTNMHQWLKDEGLQSLLRLPSASMSRNSRMSYHRTGKYWRSGMSSIAFTKSSIAFTVCPLTSGASSPNSVRPSGPEVSDLALSILYPSC